MSHPNRYPEELRKAFGDRTVPDDEAGSTGPGPTSAADEHPAPGPPATDPNADIRERLRPDTLDAGLAELRDCPGVRKCRVCGCTSDDCRQCIEKTGRPCHWIETDLCSACAEPAGVPPDVSKRIRRALLAAHDCIVNTWPDEADRQRVVDWINFAIGEMEGLADLAAAEPAGVDCPACDCGWLTRTHATTCPRFELADGWWKCPGCGHCVPPGNEWCKQCRGARPKPAAARSPKPEAPSTAGPLLHCRHCDCFHRPRDKCPHLRGGPFMIRAEWHLPGDPYCKLELHATGDVTEPQTAARRVLDYAAAMCAPVAEARSAAEPAGVPRGPKIIYDQGFRDGQRQAADDLRAAAEPAGHKELVLAARHLCTAWTHHEEGTCAADDFETFVDDLSEAAAACSPKPEACPAAEPVGKIANDELRITKGDIKNSPDIIEQLCGVHRALERVIIERIKTGAADNSAGVGSDSCERHTPQDEGPQPPAVCIAQEFQCGKCGHGFVYTGPAFYPACPKCNADDSTDNSTAVAFPVAHYSAGVGSDFDTPPNIKHGGGQWLGKGPPIGGRINPPDLADRLVACLGSHFLTLAGRKQCADQPTVYLNAVKSELRAIIDAAAEPAGEFVPEPTPQPALDALAADGREQDRRNTAAEPAGVPADVYQSLVTFGQHKKSCCCHGFSVTNCDCGFSTALAAAEAAGGADLGEIDVTATDPRDAEARSPEPEARSAAEPAGKIVGAIFPGDPRGPQFAYDHGFRDGRAAADLDWCKAKHAAAEPAGEIANDELRITKGDIKNSPDIIEQLCGVHRALEHVIIERIKTAAADNSAGVGSEEL